MEKEVARVQGFDKEHAHGLLSTVYLHPKTLEVMLVFLGPQTGYSKIVCHFNSAIIVQITIGTVLTMFTQTATSRTFHPTT